jgi:hypothetical protein
MNEPRRANDASVRDRDVRRIVLSGLLAVCLLLVVSGCLPFRLPFSLPGMQSDGTRVLPPTPTATKTPFSTSWPATWTPTVTPSITPTTTRYPTLTPYGTPGPGGGAWSPGGGTVGGDLGIQYWITDVYCTSKSSYAADFVIRASGGDGNYTYYRDIDKIAGPVKGEVGYHLVWRECGGAPGTFFVESGDGQRVKILFWVDKPDCCVKATPTP